MVCLFVYRTLNNNNLTTIPRELFSGMTRLRALRLSDNPLSCDCHLSWLSRYLRSAPRLAPYTRCNSPGQLKGQNVADLHDEEFKCSGWWKRYLVTLIVFCSWTYLLFITWVVFLSKSFDVAREMCYSNNTDSLFFVNFFHFPAAILAKILWSIFVFYSPLS